MLDPLLVAYLPAALLLTVTPGPDTVLVLSNGSRFGLRTALATTAGIALGGVSYALLFGLGVARVLAYSPTAFAAVKLAGALYLCYLGLTTLYRTFVRGRVRQASVPPSESAVSDRTVPLPGPAAALRPARVPALSSVLGQGFLTNALNPKVALFYLAFLPQFMRPGDSFAERSVLLIAIHYAMGAVWLSGVALAAERMRQVLTSRRVERWLDGILGTLMTGFGIRLAFWSR